MRAAVSGTEMCDAPELMDARKNHRHGRYLYDSEKTDVWAVGNIYFQLRSGMHLIANTILSIKGRESKAFTPATDTTRANDLFWRRRAAATEIAGLLPVCVVNTSPGHSLLRQVGKMATVHSAERKICI